MVNNMGAPYGLVEVWIQPFYSRSSTYPFASYSSTGDIIYTLGLGGSAALSRRCILWVAERNTGVLKEANTS